MVNGDKAPDFVGVQRGGFGNPFDVRTASGEPLADEMRAAIASAMQHQGFTVVPLGGAAPRKLELRILEWKTDVMMSMSVQYDLSLSVFDGQGALMASTTTKGDGDPGWRLRVRGTRQMQRRPSSCVSRR